MTEVPTRTQPQLSALSSSLQISLSEFVSSSTKVLREMIEVICSKFSCPENPRRVDATMRDAELVLLEEASRAKAADSICALFYQIF